MFPMRLHDTSGKRGINERLPANSEISWNDLRRLAKPSVRITSQIRELVFRDSYATHSRRAPVRYAESLLRRERYD